MWLKSQLGFGSFFPKMYHRKMVIFWSSFFTDFFSLLLWAWITFPFLVTEVLGGIHCLEVATWNRKITVYSAAVGYLWKHLCTLQSYWDFRWTVMLFVNYRKKIWSRNGFQSQRLSYSCYNHVVLRNSIPHLFTWDKFQFALSDTSVQCGRL